MANPFGFVGAVPNGHREMKLLTPETVAESLSISRSTVLRMIADGSLPAVCLRRGKRKGVYRVREEILERWIVSREREGAKTQRGAHFHSPVIGAENNGGNSQRRDTQSCARGVISAIHSRS